jgi:hypothetical protein
MSYDRFDGYLDDLIREYRRECRGLSRIEIKQAWDEYSEMSAASWLTPDSAEQVELIMSKAREARMNDLEGRYTDDRRRYRRDPRET